MQPLSATTASAGAHPGRSPAPRPVVQGGARGLPTRAGSSPLVSRRTATGSGFRSFFASVPCPGHTRRVRSGLRAAKRAHALGPETIADKGLVDAVAETTEIEDEPATTGGHGKHLMQRRRRAWLASPEPEATADRGRRPSLMASWFPRFSAARWYAAPEPFFLPAAEAPAGGRRTASPAGSSAAPRSR